MRIISGFAKGRRLQTPPADKGKKEIRPTTDRAREALFSILGSRIDGASVLDLFAGTGAMGIEALSRGAKALLFIDNNQVALSLIKNNISAIFPYLQQNQIVRVMQHNLQTLPDISALPKELRSFNIIFADPPYNTGLSNNTLEIVPSILSNNTLLIIEERCNVTLPETLGSVTRNDKRIYGEVAFHFYKKS